MTEEEKLAEESLTNYRRQPKWAGKMFMRDENTCYKDGFLAGLEAGKKIAIKEMTQNLGEAMNTWI